MAVPHERRFLPGFLQKDTDAPGLIQEVDGSTWVIEPDGTRTRLPAGGPGASTLIGLTDVTGAPTAGTAPVSDGAGAFSLTDVATQAELDQRTWLGVKQFGAIGDNATDDTAAFQAAIDASRLADTTTRTVYAPAGKYLVHELEWTGKLPMIVGDGPASTILRYNGAGGPGSYLIRSDLPASSPISYCGFRDLSMQGWKGGANDPVCETGYKNVPVAGYALDWGFVCDHVLIENFYGAGLDIGESVQFYIDRIRFNAILQGYCIKLRATEFDNNDPFSIARFTYDNGPSVAFGTAAQNFGVYDGVHAGKGFLSLEDCVGNSIRLVDGRVELNIPLLTVGGRRSLIYSNNTFAGTTTSVICENVHGLFYEADAGVFCKDVTGRTDLTLIDSTFSFCSKVLETPTLAHDIEGRGFMGRLTSVASYYGQTQGMTLQSKNIEVRDTVPPDGFTAYKAGDIVLRATPVPAQGIGVVCVTPTVGWACPDGGSLTTTAVVTSGSAVVTVTPLHMRNFGVGANVVVVGAGAAAVNLSTRVTALDPDAHTVTLAVAASTSVNPATINIQTPTWAEFGQRFSADDVAPFAGVHAQGEIAWNTEPSIGQPFGWVCVTAGTPGDWRPFGQYVTQLNIIPAVDELALNVHSNTAANEATKILNDTSGGIKVGNPYGAVEQALDILDLNGNILAFWDRHGRLVLTDGQSVSLGATTGTKVGETGEKVGFLGATPVARPLLATGAAHTVDDVITVLQTLGLAKQS